MPSDPIPSHRPDSTAAAPDRAREVARMVGEANPPDVDGEICALVVPHTCDAGGGPLTARVVKTVVGSPARTVIVMASGAGEAAGRIHVSRRETYPSSVGAIPIDLKTVDELCDEDDDIYADDRGHFVDGGIGIQLPFLREAVPAMRAVPVVMGDESPDFCRELGSAVGEVMYNQPTLVVACVDVRDQEGPGLDLLRKQLADYDVDGLMRSINAEHVRLDGGGPLLSALIAARHRRATRVHVVELSGAEGAEPGRLGLVISRV